MMFFGFLAKIENTYAPFGSFAEFIFIPNKISSHATEQRR